MEDGENSLPHDSVRRLGSHGSEAELCAAILFLRAGKVLIKAVISVNHPHYANLGIDVCVLASWQAPEPTNVGHQ